MLPRASTGSFKLQPFLSPLCHGGTLSWLPHMPQQYISTSSALIQTPDISANLLQLFKPCCSIAGPPQLATVAISAYPASLLPSRPPLFPISHFHLCFSSFLIAPTQSQDLGCCPNPFIPVKRGQNRKEISFGKYNSKRLEWQLAQWLIHQCPGFSSSR